MRGILVRFCQLLLSIFFRRIEVVGRDLLPKEGAIVFAGNHPSGLVDPLFLLCLSGRRISFLAKEPLFRMPFVSIFVKSFECLPVYRSSDGADPKQNRAMMRAAVDLLARGNALALFPEGTSHSDSALKRFRSGAARIALSARALSDSQVSVVPSALYYESKETFRSRAVLAFGSPLLVPLVSLDEEGNSPIEAGSQLTLEIAQAVEALMPTAETAEGLVLAEHAERLIGAAIRDTPERCPSALKLSDGNVRRPSLAARMRLRRRLIDRYRQWIFDDEVRVEGLVRRIKEVESDLEQFALPIDAPPTHSKKLEASLARPLFLAVALFPLAAVGILLHAPAYQLVRFLALRMASDSVDIAATVKLVSGLLLFPLTWITVAGFTYSQWSLSAALISVPLAMMSAWFAISFLSLSGKLRRRLALTHGVITAKIDWNELCERRAALAEEMSELLEAQPEVFARS